jgi:DNA-binding YbaB/EbfC family protein
VNPNDLQEMMKRAEQMQSRMGDLQKDLSARSFEANSGGGMVEAKVSGALRVVSIKIEKSLFAEEDLTMLQDLAAAAINAAPSKAQESVGQELARVQQSMLTGLGN